MSSFLYDVSLDTQQWEDDSQVEKEMIIIVSSQRRADKREGCKKSEKKGHRIKFRRRDMPEKRKMLETSHKRAPPCSEKSGISYGTAVRCTAVSFSSLLLLPKTMDTNLVSNRFYLEAAASMNRDWNSTAVQVCLTK